MKKAMTFLILAALILSISGCKSCKDEPKKPVEVFPTEFKSAKVNLLDFADSYDAVVPDSKDWQYIGKAYFRVTEIPYQPSFYKVEVMLQSIQPVIADIRAISMVFDFYGTVQVSSWYTNYKPNNSHPLLQDAINIGGGGMFCNQIGQQVRFSWFAAAPFAVLTSSARSLFSFTVKVTNPIPGDPSRIEWNLSENWFNEISPNGRENMDMTYINYVFGEDNN